jgi:hypothetical protein
MPAAAEQDDLTEEPSSLVSSGNTVVLSLDYDGCMDILFEGSFLRFSRRDMELRMVHELRAYIRATFERITAGASRVILMVGSNRQSASLDRLNRDLLEHEVGEIPSDVGWVRTDFVNFATEMGWEINKVLLADKVNGVAPGTAWDDSCLNFNFTGGKGRDKFVKKELLEFQIAQLDEITGPIDFFFLTTSRTTLIMHGISL